MTYPQFPQQPQQQPQQQFQPQQQQFQPQQQQFQPQQQFQQGAPQQGGFDAQQLAGGFPEQQAPKFEPISADPSATGISFGGTSSGPTPKFNDTAMDSVVVIRIHGIESTNTVRGPRDNVLCDYIVLTGQNAGVEAPQARIFGGRIIGAARRSIQSGQRFLVGLVGHEANPKPGNSPAVILNPITDEQAMLARGAIVAAGWLSAEEAGNPDPGAIEQARQLLEAGKANQAGAPQQQGAPQGQFQQQAPQQGGFGGGGFGQ